MKIERLYENTEESRRYWLYTDRDEDGGAFDSITYLFDNEEDVLNFMANKVYNIFLKYCDKKERGDALQVLDDCDNYEAITEFLNESIDEGILGDYDDRIYIETTRIDKNIELEDWIQLRRTAKKYNV